MIVVNSLDAAEQCCAGAVLAARKRTLTAAEVEKTFLCSALKLAFSIGGFVPGSCKTGKILRFEDSTTQRSPGPEKIGIGN